MIRQRLGLDDKDMKIVNWLMQDPDISQNEIAKRLKLSQPSVNSRINKLKAKGVIHYNVGMNFNKTDLAMVRVDFTATDPSGILHKLKDCSFFVNGFVMSGKNNVSVFLVSEDLKKIDEIINTHIRTHDGISDIDVSVVVNSAADFLFKLNLEQELNQECFKLQSCATCEKVH